MGTPGAWGLQGRGDSRGVGTPGRGNSRTWGLVDVGLVDVGGETRRHGRRGGGDSGT